MLQRLSIRGKILAVVAVPILVLLLAVGVVTLNATQNLNNTRNVEQLLSVLSASRAFEADLQTERNLSVNYVDSYTDGLNKRDDAEETTDIALTALDDAVAANPTPEGEEALAQVNAALGRTSPDVFLADLRAVDITDNGIGEWPTFPSEADAQATADSYAAIAGQIDDIAASTPNDADITSNLTSLSFAVNFEGVTTQRYLVDPAVFQDELIAAQPQTDITEDGYNEAVDGIGDSSVNEPTLLTVDDAAEQLAQLPNVRNQVVNRSISVVVLNGYFGDTVEPLVKLSSDVASVASDRTLAGQLRAYNSMDILVERVLSEEVYTDHLLRQGYFLPGDSTFQRSLVSLSDIALDNAQATVDPLGVTDQVPPFGASANAAEGDTSSYVSIRTNIASGLDASLVTERGNDWPLQVSQELDVQVPIRDSLWSDAQSTSTAAVQSNVLQTILTIVGAVLVVVATIFIALLIARRIIGPLRRLTTTATAVRQELPRMVERVALPGESVDVSEVQIPVESSDEIGRLAEAFNGVNATTLAIAGEQAALRGSISEMFVNVARRDQVLLNRQLSSIDEMERTEEDPETLTRLFALDHLATRMRRNSESLLVLAGIDTGRRLRRPMPLADVIRTASSEIELYERVQLELDADPAMVGHSALTAAHLFAELLENATVFSDPGMPVVVRTFERDGNFVVEVEDTGIGMTLDELREANNRVASTAASEILGAQRLGLFVVGRIARRVGASVAITSKEGAGTTATVTMPPTLFDTRSQEPTAHVSSTATDAALHAPAALVGHSVADEIIDDANEPDATKRPGAPAYQPAAVESGVSLAGRPVDAPAPAAVKASEPSVDDLIAADAAAAPAATAVDAAALSGGLTASGLPARRRRAAAEAGTENEDERAKIIGLPARATADQLSALDAETPSGFKPTVSAEEIAPQTAEERASMFRGFRSRKDAEADQPEEVDPEAESLGQAARRGAFASAAAPTDGEGTAAEPSLEIPLLEDDELAEFDTPTPEVAPTSEAADSRPSFAMPKFDVSGNSAAEPLAGAVGPGAAAGAVDALAAHHDHGNADDAEPPAEEAPMVVPSLEGDGDEPHAAPEEDAPMVVPTLEADDEPEASHEWGEAPVAPNEAASAFDAAPLVEPVSPVNVEPEYEAPAQPYTPSSGVEQVSLEMGPTFAEQASSAPAVQPSYLASPPPMGEPLSVGTEPASQAPTPQAPARQASAPQSPVQHMDPAQLAALTATPSMDDLMSGDADDDKPNFFSRLFGRGKKGTEGPAPTPAPVAPTPFAPASAPAVPAASETNGAATRGFAHAPTTDAGAPYGVPSAQAAPEPVAPTVDTPAQFEPVGQFSSDTAPAVPEVAPAPAAFAPDPAPLPEPEPAASWQPPQPPATPAAPAASAPVPAAAASFFAPRGESATPATHFSPDELASPMGWEAAGASALQAAEPEVQTSYSPTVDLDSDHSGESDLSSVFGEFSSLSSERPKVEKTRAGLQKRRATDAPPVEVTPIEEEVVVAPRERNADDVRSRFSSFYSGTARARSDAAEFERSQSTTEAKE